MDSDPYNTQAYTARYSHSVRLRCTMVDSSESVDELKVGNMFCELWAEEANPLLII